MSDKVKPFKVKYTCEQKEENMNWIESIQKISWIYSYRKMIEDNNNKLQKGTG